MTLVFTPHMASVETPNEISKPAMALSRRSFDLYGVPRAMG